MGDVASQRYRYVFGSAEFDEARQELRVHRQPVKLERKPLEVLVQLLRHSGQIVTREQLGERVWKTRSPEEGVMANAIRKLRVALGDSDRVLIVTQPNVGYRLGVVPRRVAVGRGYELLSTAHLRVAIQQCFSDLREIDEAIAHGRRAVEAASLAGGALSELTLSARMQLAADLARGGRHAEAASLLEEIRCDLAHDDGNHTLNWARWWWVRSDLQAFCLELERSQDSAIEADRFLAMEADPPPRLFDGIRTRLGKARRMAGDLARSEQVFLDLAATQVKRDGAAAETIQLTRIELAHTFLLQERADAALRVAREAADRLSASLGPYNLATLWAHNAVAAAQFKRQDYAAAAATWQHVVGTLECLSSHVSDFSVTAQSNVGLSLLYAGMTAQAEAAFGKALAMSAELFPTDAPRVQSIRYWLGFALAEEGQIERMKQALDGLDPKALERANQADDWEGRVDYLRGRLALAEGRYAQARELLGSAVQALAANDDGSLFAPAKVLRWLGRCPDVR